MFWPLYEHKITLLETDYATVWRKLKEVEARHERSNLQRSGDI